MLRRALIAGLVAGAFALPGTAPGGALHAQPANCSVLAGTGSVNTLSTTNGSVTHMRTPRLSCNDGRYMEADSLVHFQASGYTNMLGRVVFRADGRELRAATARYFEGLGRLEASGSVNLRDLAQGTVITGEELLHLRVAPQRPTEQLTVSGGRPRALLYPRQDTLRDDTPPPDSITPWEVVADRIHLVGDQYFEAQGSVGVVRDSLMAFADSLRYDQVGGGLDLVGGPARVVQGSIDLTGQEMRLLLPGDVIEEVTARRDAVLTTDSLDVDAPFIRIFMEEGALHRLVAAVPGGGGARPGQASSARPTPGQAPAAAPEGDASEAEAPPRAHATGPGLTMVADSIDALVPGHRLERMVAIGEARAVSTARDTLNTPSTPDDLIHDWIEGDTVRALFEPAAIPEGDASDAPEVVLASLEAHTDARSLYRLDPDSLQRSDTTSFRGRLPVNYTEAESIVLTFDRGEVSRMEWVGLRRGIQLQPVRTPADTTSGDPPGGTDSSSPPAAADGSKRSASSGGPSA